MGGRESRGCGREREMGIMKGKTERGYWRKREESIRAKGMGLGGKREEDKRG